MTEPSPELTTTTEQPTATMRAEGLRTDEIAGFFDRAFGTIFGALAEQDVTPTGPALALYPRPPGDTVDIEAGVPVDRAIVPAGEVVPGVLPAGKVARLEHHGAYDDLGTSWDRLRSWITGEGLTPSAVLWEVYVTEPSPDMDPADLVTELNWLLDD